MTNQLSPKPLQYLVIVYFIIYIIKHQYTSTLFVIENIHSTDEFMVGILFNMNVEQLFCRNISFFFQYINRRLKRCLLDFEKNVQLLHYNLSNS